MTKEQFFMELEECLQGEVSAHELADSLSYYRQYFDEQAAEGKSEQEVIRELGNARLIARSIIDAHGLEGNSGAGSYRSDNAGSYSGSDSYYSYDEAGDAEDEKGGFLQTAGRTVVSIAVLVIAIFVGLFILRALLPLIFLVVAVVLITRLLR